MNLVTVTVDLDTHAIVPIEPTREQIKKVCDAWIDSTSRMLLNKACAAIKAGIAAAPPYQSEQVWIPVSERLPDHRNSVLCYAVNINGKINIKNSWLNPIMNSFYVDYAGDEPCEKITHWMNLPAAPKGEKE